MGSSLPSASSGPAVATGSAVEAGPAARTASPEPGPYDGSPLAWIEVAVLAPLPMLLSYRVPPRLLGQVSVGARVLVPMGPRKSGGVVARMVSEAEAAAREGEGTATAPGSESGSGSGSGSASASGSGSASASGSASGSASSTAIVPRVGWDAAALASSARAVRAAEAGAPMAWPAPTRLPAPPPLPSSPPARQTSARLVPASARRQLADVLEVLPDEPSLTPELVALALWIAEYYEAPPGEVIRAQLPAGSATQVRDVMSTTAAGNAALEGGALPPRHRDLLMQLADSATPAAKLSASQRKLLLELRTQGLVDAVELRSTPRATLREVAVARLAVAPTAPAELADPADPAEPATVRHRRAPRRLEVLAALADGPRVVDELCAADPKLRAALRALVKAGEVVLEQRDDLSAAGSPDASLAGGAGDASRIPVLTDEQQVAVTAICARLGHGFAPFLVHGVTGSGKTEVYLRVIAEVLARGQTALVLVPEIALTPQLAGRFRARFGDAVAILHSGLSERDRLVEWQRLRRGLATIAVGARSAVFAPLSDLGIIVIDEEHDGSFKQDDGVRYHARDVALVRAQRLGVPCILGSATPSLESYWQAQRGSYALLTMTQRPTARPLPEVEIVDLRKYMPDGDDLISAPLGTAIATALAAGNQAILFLNRRGFATFVMCRSCGHGFRCPHCAVSLTYHQSSDRMLCHYCGFAQRVPETCPSCAANGAIERKGLGTEKIAASLATRFPSARVARLDRDVAAGAKAEGILAQVARRQVDILVGTQMVTKGHDFPGVTLVGVLCADTGLNLPDFRASERTFQLLSQVAGRAGRGERAGRVLIQTYRPTAVAVVAAAHHDYQAFYAAEIESRIELGYPPSGRLIAVRIDGPDANAVVATANRLGAVALRAAAACGQEAAVEVRGPVAAPLERLRGRTRWQIWLRSGQRHALRRVARALVGTEPDRGVRVGLDVDPVSAL
jgi:primosomal protein N' (replication factor Y) (superfamily II helicase)